MIRKIIQALIAIGFIIIGYTKLEGAIFQKEVIWYGIAGLLTLIGLLLEFIYTNRKRLRVSIFSKYLALRGKKIRFSMSYLYRIEVEGKYLLVKNNNYGHFQLVGGKYKILEDTRSKLKTDFGAMDDPKLPNSGIMKDDFALFIPAKNAIKFLNWFNKGIDREVSHWREFYEELIVGDGESFLSLENFPYVNYNYRGKVLTPIKRTPGWDDCYEILQYDILDLVPTPEQRQELKVLFKKGDSAKIKWASSNLIDSLGHDSINKNKKYDIGQHTKWALNMKWSKV
ncbi:hypothetical protein ES676_09670 [Bizionia saleffrena]|uniref:CD-NTase-associated protein 16 NUDIX domain-containing protein n=1 Tax=Bizionia saleffrena TaxID=291189 RepID=A0A8H2QE38_9FLAO|nr:hypothetical protein [Bizionia saleffrena]TYB73016.1 hypothetical protein ES676_09670 [Bizionia saleffrena]